MNLRTTEPVAAQGTREGEPSSCFMRNGLRPQPARLVRGSSRRIMTMRFRPANIRVINRRVSSPLPSALLSRRAKGNETCGFFPLCNPHSSLKHGSETHQQERVPAKPPVEVCVNARTVLADKGSLRRAKSRRALVGSAPFRPKQPRDGRLRREHSGRWTTLTTRNKGLLFSCRRKASRNGRG
jgi:hypothetical protein